MLAHLPPLPLLIDYRSTDPAEDNSGIHHAIQQRDRIDRVVLQAPHSTLEQLIVTIDELFPRLDALSLLSTTKSEGSSELTLPRTFTAPNLRYLTLHSISLPTGLQTLTSASSLVTLELTDIQYPGYFTPEQLLTQLQHIPHLQELSIGFFVPLPSPSAEEELMREPMMSTTLPALTWLEFRGESAYLESLVARIRAPLLERFNVTLFYNLIFTLPHLFEFIEKTEELRHPVASVIFNEEAVAFVIGPRDYSNAGTFSLHISCKPFDWQIDSATQVCSVLAPVLSVVEDLTLECDELSLQGDWRKDSEIDGIEAWHGIFWPFSVVKKLHIGHPLALEFSGALESDNAGFIAEILPELQELQAVVNGWEATNPFAAFIDARRDAGRPVQAMFEETILFSSQMRLRRLDETLSRDWQGHVERHEPRSSPFVQQTAEVPEEGASRQTHVNVSRAGFERIDGEDDPNASAADKDFKPLFLKDLFRYARFANRVSVSYK